MKSLSLILFFSFLSVTSAHAQKAFVLSAGGEKLTDPTGVYGYKAIDMGKNTSGERIILIDVMSHFVGLICDKKTPIATFFTKNEKGELSELAGAVPFDTLENCEKAAACATPEKINDANPIEFTEGTDAKGFAMITLAGLPDSCTKKK